MRNLRWILLLVQLSWQFSSITDYKLVLHVLDPHIDLGEGVQISNTMHVPRIAAPPFYSVEDFSVLIIIDTENIQLWTTPNNILHVPGLGVRKHVIYAKLILTSGNVVAISSKVEFNLIGRCSFLEVPKAVQYILYSIISMKIGSTVKQIEANIRNSESIEQSINRIVNAYPLLAEQRAFLNEHYIQQLYQQKESQIDFKQKLEHYRQQKKEIKLILGAHDTHTVDWISTNINVLDITKDSTFSQYFSTNEVHSMLSEHVFEHLTLSESYQAMRVCWKYLSWGGRLRIAVPDGWRKNLSDSFYQSEIRDNHKVIYNAKLIARMLESTGFIVNLLEYHDELGISRINSWNLTDGIINRSSKLDSRGPISIIIDGIKEKPLLQPLTNSLKTNGSERLIEVCKFREFKRMLLDGIDSHNLTKIGSLLAKDEPSKYHLKPKIIMAESIDVLGSFEINIFIDHMLNADLKIVCIIVDSVEVDCTATRKSTYTLTLPIRNIGTHKITVGVYDSTYQLVGDPASKNIRFIYEISPNCKKKCQKSLKHLMRRIFSHPHVLVLSLTIFVKLVKCQSWSASPSALILCYENEVGQWNQFLDIFTDCQMIRYSDTIIVPLLVGCWIQEAPPVDSELKNHTKKLATNTTNMCFFTLVLNGMPFIRHHIQELLKISLGTSIEWEWHIVEGIAQGRAHHWAPYSDERISGFDKNGLSIDGTSQYIDYLAESFRDNIVIHRSQSSSWVDKLQMVNTVIKQIKFKKCILVEIDVDELWNGEDLIAAHQMMSSSESKNCAYFHCHFFITPNLVTISPGKYSHNDEQEWLRMWKFEQGMVFLSHAPPLLAMWNATARDWVGLQGDLCYSQVETENLGLVFTHYAYVTYPQVAFKEQFYGYKDAVLEWKNLIDDFDKGDINLPVDLSTYLSWIPGGTYADIPAHRTIATQHSIAMQPESSRGHFDMVIAVDAVVFQSEKVGKKGIWRVWKEILPILLQRIFDLYPWTLVIILCRTSFSDILEKKIGNVLMLKIPPYDVNNSDRDDEMINYIIKRYRADVFLSTMYTRAISCPNVLLLHDMIPEHFQWHPPGFTNVDGIWKARVKAIMNADRYVTVSETTKRDLLRFYPNIDENYVRASFNGASNIFYSRNESSINSFKRKYGISKNYLLCVGNRLGYKQVHVLYMALQFLQNKLVNIPMLVLVGPPVHTDELKQLDGLRWVRLKYISDDELAVCYSGAIALVYLSIYEGFGLPVIEAMKCGCPVVLSSNVPSVHEIAGSAGIYVNPSNITDVSGAIVDLMDTKTHIKHPKAILMNEENWQRLANDIADQLMSFRIKKSIFDENNQ